MMRRTQYERFINENNMPQWIAFLRYWYRAHGSSPVDASMLIDEFHKSGISPSTPPDDRRRAISLINKMAWHAAGWGFDAFVIAREGVGELNKQMFRVCCFDRSTPDGAPEMDCRDER